MINNHDTPSYDKKMIELSFIDYRDILPIWETKLWPDRISKIEEMSCMTYQKDYDIQIFDLYEPTFWGIYYEDKLIAVNSGHRTSETDYRSRGLWVDRNYRRRGMTKLLFNALFEQAKKEKVSLVWSCPRKAALAAYEASSFQKISDWFDEGMEFGPNCYVEKIL